MTRVLKVMTQGCVHGELDRAFEIAKKHRGIDLILINGDFQAVRNDTDLRCMSVPPKYLKRGDFRKYYIGPRAAPVLTIVIGGNHEASNHMTELFYGGWLAKNIYYLGAAGVVNFKGLRIGGISGIWQPEHYRLGHGELVNQFQGNAMRSAYHTRQFEVMKLLLIKDRMDLFMAHDWPQGIAHFGDLKQLLEEKPFLKTDIKTGKLGNPAHRLLLEHLKPSLWLGSHMHVRFTAEFPHNDPSIRFSQNPNEIELPSGAYVRSDTADTTTKFLALDKCLPRRKFSEILTVECPDYDKHYKTHSKSAKVSKEMQKRNPTIVRREMASSIGRSDFESKIVRSKKLFYDTEWLAITKTMNEYLSLSMDPQLLPDTNSAEFKSKLEQNKEWVVANIVEKGRLGVISYRDQLMPQGKGVFPAVKKGRNINKVHKKIVYDYIDNELQVFNRSLQTEMFCRQLDMENKFAPYYQFDTVPLDVIPPYIESQDRERSESEVEEHLVGENEDIDVDVDAATAEYSDSSDVSNLDILEFESDDESFDEPLTETK
ncbi:hypothetical protein CANCADRAFT_33026 [Tortispora caseinolytica NRRL Y-17796]|uniref:Lariat debranching enzyme C-terminal domain-containing protein n=1 Tax=Tortispora caseinolytica NRRL Y-17796 TaxID=767744 RepID=A0A1E4T9U9_9ASCO|nr:hypothetical protein CANCADRAFT_33026 [Tortispora caseinolytica NRRL Y-17796]